jgi:hypothetical protein
MKQPDGAKNGVAVDNPCCQAAVCRQSSFQGQSRLEASDAVTVPTITTPAAMMRKKVMVCCQIEPV